MLDDYTNENLAAEVEAINILTVGAIAKHTDTVMGEAARRLKEMDTIRDRINAVLRRACDLRDSIPLDTEQHKTFYMSIGGITKDLGQVLLDYKYGPKPLADGGKRPKQYA